MDKDKQQTRNFKSKIEFRAVQQEDNSGSATLEGYIAKFNSPTVLWTGYMEQLEPHCFDNTLADGHNTFLLYAHDWTKPLASTETGTLVLNVDDVGLHFVATVDTSISYVADIVNLIKSGLVIGCSFGFYILNDNEVYDAETDTITDTLLEVQLLEGSVLTDPQYADTTVTARAKNKVEEYRKQQEQLKTDKKTLDLIKLELDID